MMKIHHHHIIVDSTAAAIPGAFNATEYKKKNLGNIFYAVVLAPLLCQCLSWIISFLKEGSDDYLQVKVRHEISLCSTHARKRRLEIGQWEVMGYPRLTQERLVFAFRRTHQIRTPRMFLNELFFRQNEFEMERSML